MPFTMTMPKLSPTMEEGTIAKWHKKIGDYVESGDLILEVATDKATVEYNALDAGWLKKMLKQEGQSARVNEPLAVFTEEKNESIDGYQPEGEEGVVSVSQAKAEPVLKKSKNIPQATKAATQAPTITSKPKLEKEVRAERIIASPLAKTLAKKHGIDLSSIQGTGPRGRITSRDLDEAATSSEEISEPTSQHFPTPAPVSSFEVTERPLSPVRKVIAARLQYSKQTIPHFYLRQEMNVDQLVSLREETKKLERNFTINDFIIKAVAIALKKHPNVNVGFNQEMQAVIHYPSVDLSIAVTISGGLITPIIKDAQAKSLTHLSQEIKQLAQKAKEGKLQPHEYQGGSFTISNLGMFGVTDFQAIINPSQAAILAIGTIQEKPVVKNGVIVAGRVLSITLSCDHRAIDGAEGAQFMQTLRQLIENPILFLSE